MPGVMLLALALLLAADPHDVGVWRFDGACWGPRPETSGEIDDQALRALAAHDAKEPVTCLMLSGRGALPGISAQGWAILGQLVHLERLIVGGTGISRAGLAAIGKLPALKSLDLWKLPFTAGELAPLAARRSWRS